MHLPVYILFCSYILGGLSIISYEKLPECPVLPEYSVREVFTRKNFPARQPVSQNHASFRETNRWSYYNPKPSAWPGDPTNRSITNRYRTARYPSNRTTIIAAGIACIATRHRLQVVFMSYKAQSGFGNLSMVRKK
jgi:hypothetical protein